MGQSVVALDFFNTLFYRDCNQETVLYIWAKAICEFLRFSIDERSMYELRKNTEAELRRISEKEDITYDELIRGIYDRLIYLNIQVINFQEFYKKSLEIESKCEIDHILPNYKIIDSLIKIVDVKFIIISDYYCNHEIYDLILKKFNIRNFFDKIYISSEIGKRKSTGSLYTYVLKDLNIKPSSLIMIGDNRKSDYKIPVSLGIKCKFSPYLKTKTAYKKRGILTLIKNLNINYGYNGYIPAITIFLDRLHHLAVKNNANMLLFCSREGQNLKYLYDSYLSTLYPYSTIKTKYIYVSRRSTLIASLSDIDHENFDRIFRQYKEILVCDFLQSLNFKAEEIYKILIISKLDLDSLLTFRDNYRLIEILKDNNLFRKLYESKRVDQKRLLTKYINLLSDGSKTIHIVDIGWKGTIQDNLFSALDKERNFQGYYFGLTKGANIENGNKKTGLMFDEIKNLRDSNLFIYNYIHLEKIFSADHNSVLYYCEEDNQVKPKLSDDSRDIEIYNYVKCDQKIMNKSIQKFMKIFIHSKWIIADFDKILEKKYLKFLTVILPKKTELVCNFRSKFRENFGNISGEKNLIEDFSISEKLIKRRFLYVDYIYRLLDIYSLEILYPIAHIYSLIVYFIMVIKLKI